MFLLPLLEEDFSFACVMEGVFEVPASAMGLLLELDQGKEFYLLLLLQNHLKIQVSSIWQKNSLCSHLPIPPFIRFGLWDPFHACPAEGVVFFSHHFYYFCSINWEGHLHELPYDACKARINIAMASLEYCQQPEDDYHGPENTIIKFTVNLRTKKNHLSHIFKRKEQKTKQNKESTHIWGINCFSQHSLLW